MFVITMVIKGVLIFVYQLNINYSKKIVGVQEEVVMHLGRTCGAFG
jgi:hypothetical protein